MGCRYRLASRTHANQARQGSKSCTNGAKIGQSPSEQDEKTVKEAEGVGTGAVDGGTHCDGVGTQSQGLDHLHDLHQGPSVVHLHHRSNAQQVLQLDDKLNFCRFMMEVCFFISCSRTRYKVLCLAGHGMHILPPNLPQQRWFSTNQHHHAWLHQLHQDPQGLR